MAPRSTCSTASHTSSRSSDPMDSGSTHQPQHAFLTPSRASTISSWTSSLPERSPNSQTNIQADVEAREAAIEAYQQLKLALFSKTRASNTGRRG
ncbi:hypothetical protein BKA66DRAFT_432029 [Pyrenochaeta sp. MPI-SDFR-AT-0127]|nr:hypothetical protein BKA66DRAFT_432029 [Pyrenochaeta sp. MPI-SDFR-AT-0127]